MATYQERLEAAKVKLQKIYPDATIEQTIDDNGNAIWRTNVPGVKIIESMNVNALEIFDRLIELSWEWKETDNRWIEWSNYIIGDKQ